jgi:sarcosine oxidase, subunit gamma
VTAEQAPRSPLVHRAPDLGSIETATGGSVRIAEVPLLTQLDLRFDPVLGSRLPWPLPARPNTYEAAPPGDVLWLGPDEWLLVGPEPARDLIAGLDEALAGEHHSVVDVSAARAVVEMNGPGALDLLSKGCGLDLHPRSWGAGKCAQTLLARVPVIVQQRGETTRVFVRPSYGDYLADWLLDAVAG